MKMLSDKTREKYYTAIIAAINASIDPFLNMIDAADILPVEGRPEQSEIEKLQGVVNSFEELKQAFIADEMTGFQESQLVVILHQTKANLTKNKLMIEAALKDLIDLIKICEIAQKQQLKS